MLLADVPVELVAAAEQQAAGHTLERHGNLRFVVAAPDLRVLAGFAGDYLRRPSRRAAPEEVAARQAHLSGEPHSRPVRRSWATRLPVPPIPRVVAPTEQDQQIDHEDEEKD
jgi:hypothetical protein